MEVKRTYHWMGIKIIMLRESRKYQSLLYPSSLRESLVIANRPSVAENLIRSNAYKDGFQ